jgi:hypothetical protein
MSVSDLTQLEAAALLSVTPRSLRDWEKAGDGIPRNPDGSYPGPALVAWYVARMTGEELDANRQRARKDKEAADKLALDNAKTRADLAPISIMEEEVASLLGDHRTNALGLPSKAAPLLVGLNADQIRDRLEEFVYELLGDLADYRPGARTQKRSSGAESGSPDSEASAEIDDQPVG